MGQNSKWFINYFNRESFRTRERSKMLSWFPSYRLKCKYKPHGYCSFFDIYKNTTATMYDRNYEGKNKIRNSS